MDESLNIVEFIRIGGIVPALFVLFVTWMISATITRFTDRMGSRFSERRLVLQQANTVMRFIFSFAGIAGAVVLVFRLSEQMLLAIGGTLAVAVGIALKDLAASIVAGLMILFDRPFQVGDRVSFGGFYGEIQRIGLRSVRLVTLDDNLVTIPNNKFLTDIVSSGNAGALDMLVQVDFFIGVDQDIATARRIVEDVVTTCRYAYLDKPWSVLAAQVMQEGYYAVRLRAKVYVLDVIYEKALESDLTVRVLDTFRRDGIRPPALLHRDVADEKRPPVIRAVG
ncbi:MAG: mechanosensitive ion channel [Myxococcales bacterium]|nr:mechanosensitive ion channel [Myxococcales bacterium]MCB9553303.1 mechanosensitive ion channel [Myxococcales bacterium]